MAADLRQGRQGKFTLPGCPGDPATGFNAGPRRPSSRRAWRHQQAGANRWDPQGL